MGLLFHLSPYAGIFYKAMSFLTRPPVATWPPKSPESAFSSPYIQSADDVHYHASDLPIKFSSTLFKPHFLFLSSETCPNLAHLVDHLQVQRKAPRAGISLDIMGEFQTAHKQPTYRNFVG